MRHHFIFIAFVIIMLYAGFLRFYKLDTVPPGLWYDEAINGLDAVATIHSFPHIPLVYTTEGHPREPLFLWLLALMLKIFGISSSTMKYAAPIIGILTIILFFLLTKEYFGIEWALAAMLIFAGLRWNFQINRMIFRANLINLVDTAILLFLLKYLDKRKRVYAITAGILLGVGFYTYLSFYAFAAFLAFFIVISYWRSIWKEKDFRDSILLLFLIGGGIYDILIIDYIKNPEHFVGRVGEVILFGKGVLAGIVHITVNILRVLLMFMYKGDMNQKFNIAGMPLFDYVTACVFFIGLLFTIIYVKQDIKKRLLLFYFIFMLLPSVFSVDAPHLLRAFGAAPAVALILTFGYYTLYNFLKSKISKHLAITFIAVLVLFYCTNEYKRYFVLWANDTRTWYNFNTDWYTLAQDVKMIDKEGSLAILIVNDDIYTHPTFQFETLNCKNTIIYPLSKLEKDDTLIKSVNSESKKKKYIFIYYRDLYTKELKDLITKLMKSKERITINKVYKAPDNFEWGFLYRISEQ